MLKYLLICTLLSSLFAKDTLYLNYPSHHPKQTAHSTFGKELIKLINNSKKEISFAIYGLRGQDDILQALINAKKRGVVVKGVVDSDSHNKNYYSDTYLLYRYFDTRSDHISYIMHDKFFVFDKKIVWTGSSNISDTGTGGYNANDVVVIESRVVASVYLQEFGQMFLKGRFNTKKRDLTTLHVETADSNISIFFSPKSNTYENAIKELVRKSKNYIYIPIFYLTRKDLLAELIKAHNRGVDIKIILDATAARNRYSIHRSLRKKGLLVKVENFGGKMHAKSMIIDDRFIVSGSMNLTKAGNSKNDENTLVIENQKLAIQYRKYFLKLWNNIPDKFLKRDPNPESFESMDSCFDGIDNDFDKTVDSKDRMCKK